MAELTHFDEQGRARLVDVTAKPATQRRALAAGEVHVSRETMELIKSGGLKKGDVLAVAQVAGIQAAKHTWELIPLCHQIPLTGVSLRFQLTGQTVEITAETACSGATGVEMEALSAVSAAALTVYDMCKAVQRDIRITNIRLLEKSGGQSGVFAAEEPASTGNRAGDGEEGPV